MLPWLQCRKDIRRGGGRITKVECGGGVKIGGGGGLTKEEEEEEEG